MLVRQSFLVTAAIAALCLLPSLSAGFINVAPSALAGQPANEFRLTTSEETSSSTGPSIGPAPKKRGQVLYHGPAKKKPLFNKSKALIVLGGLCLGAAIYTTTRESKRKD